MCATLFERHIHTFIKGGIMKYQLNSFDIALSVTKIANINYFEFTDSYYTVGDSHSFCELLYVDKGKITVKAENFSGTISEGQIIIHRPDELHSLACEEAIAPNVIIIGFECSSDLLEPFSKKATTLTSELRKMLAEIMQEGMSVYPPPYDQPNSTNIKNSVYPFGADQLIKIRLEAFFISLIRAGQLPHNKGALNMPTTSGKLSDIYRYISEHYKEKITLDNICFLFGTNKTSLCQSFKETYGTTVLSYINHLRVKEAKVMLRESGHSVTEISEILGFNSIHYFCRLFKKETGQSPMEYMNSIKSKLNL